jgi:ABC-type uncharacterized transport system substrate-binding protein
MAGSIGRRKFLATLGGAAAAWPLAARAQEATSPRRIGFLLVGLSPESKEAQVFRQELRKAGYFEGRNLVIEWRSANGDYDRVPALVADLIRSNVDVIVHDSTIGTQVSKRATSTIPIVMALVLDPIGSGLVASLTHPGGNITGLSMMAMELYPKRLQLLKEVNPQLTRAAVWWKSRPPIPPQGSRRNQGSRALPFDRTEFRGCAKARTVRSRLLGSHPSKRPGVVHSR